MRVAPPLLLAPMAGLTHEAFRGLVRGVGGVGLYSTEMLSARALPGEAEDSPYLILDPRSRPLSFQLLLAEPEEVGPALDRLEALRPDAIDINLGCPAPEARRRRSGAWLAGDQRAVAAVVREVRHRTARPVTAKIRLGERLDKEAFGGLCRLLEGEGVDMLTVHARLRGEPYGRRARWEWIRHAKEAVRIPVIGNGGIFTVEDARNCLAVSGCDGLMLGRGAVVRPWLFREIADELGALEWGPMPSRRELFREFCRLLGIYFPPGRRLGRLKEFTFYFSQTYAFGHHLASAVQSSRTLEDAAERAELFFDRHDGPRETP